MKVYFSDFFKVSPELLEEYGAFNISLINDLPLFIDPFLIYGSDKPKYKELHNEILDYLVFLKGKAKHPLTSAEIQSWYKFSEVKQNWFGYSLVGNNGSGLGEKFGHAFSNSIHIVFDDLGKERITQSSHIEKVCLFEVGVGKDSISDFTTNLIKQYLLEYTEEFAKSHINSIYLKKVMVSKAYFNYSLERWMQKEYTLPYSKLHKDFVLLTPKDILTKDDTWINGNDLRADFASICAGLPNSQLRSEIYNYYKSKLPQHPKKKITQKETNQAIQDSIREYPDIIKYFVKSKEENRIGAKNISEQKVDEVFNMFVHQVSQLIDILANKTRFYSLPAVSSYEETFKRVGFLKDTIENKDGYKLFYHNNQPIKKESDLQIIYLFTWFATDLDVNREVNNGRGPVDYAISYGAKDKTLVEFKLASNTKLKQNLKNQVGVYEKANKTDLSIKVIMYFNDMEYRKLIKTLQELKIDSDPNIVLIDASPKESASNVK